MLTCSSRWGGNEIDFYCCALFFVACFYRFTYCCSTESSRRRSKKETAVRTLGTNFFSPTVPVFYEVQPASRVYRPVVCTQARLRIRTNRPSAPPHRARVPSRATGKSVRISPVYASHIKSKKKIRTGPRTPPSQSSRFFYDFVYLSSFLSRPPSFALLPFPPMVRLDVDCFPPPSLPPSRPTRARRPRVTRPRSPSRLSFWRGCWTP